MIGSFYDQTITVMSHSTSTGGYWSTSTRADYTTKATLLGAVNLLDGSERFLGDGYTVRATHKLYCDPSTDLVYGTRVQWDGNSYEVIETPKNTLQKGHHYRVLLKEVDGV